MTFHDHIKAFKAAGDYEGLNRLIPYSEVIGWSVGRDDAGLFVHLPPKHENIGNTMIPAVHGGVVGALLEHSAVMQIFELDDVVGLPKVINISVAFLRPCIGTKDTYARARVIKQGKRVANVTVEAWQGDESRPVATAHAHFLLG